MTRSIGFNDEGYEQYKKIAREVLRRMMNTRPDRARYQQREAGGGGHTIWFTIESVLCVGIDDVTETTLVVVATWYNQSCTGTPPGANYEGTYDVYDICNYLSGLIPDDLIGTTGRATYHYPLDGYCEPRWIIDDLCAQPECA